MVYPSTWRREQKGGGGAAFGGGTCTSDCAYSMKLNMRYNNIVNFISLLMLMIFENTALPLKHWSAHLSSTGSLHTLPLKH
jgi:hypothetical protein